MSLAADSGVGAAGGRYCPICEESFEGVERCPADGTKLVRLAASRDPFLGRELDGQYTILEKLGQGGMGAVYRATQHSVGREVAVKVVNAHLVSEPEAIKRFLREAKLASRLGHPNAVTVIDFGQTDDGVFYLVMELVVGRTLDQVIEAEAIFKPERVVRIGAQVCDALEAAHVLQIIHRDLKPANIMLLASGRDTVKVLDFGLAKSVAPDQTTTTMTGAGALLGTPAFMPPESALGQPYDARADLYSLGVVLYLLGSGRLPFQSGSVHELIAMHATEPAPPMEIVPPELGRVVDRMLAKDPGERYQTAVEVREALEGALAHRYATAGSGPQPAVVMSSSFGRVPADAVAPTAAITMAVSPAAAAHATDAAGERPARSRRWVIGIAASIAAAAAVAVALLVMRSEEPLRPSPPKTPEVAPPPTAAAPPTASPSPSPSPDDATPAIKAIEPPAPTKTGPKRPGKPPRGQLRKDPPKGPSSAKPDPTKVPAPPPPTQGSGAAKADLPF